MNAGGEEAFVAKLNASGSSLLYFTFFGGSGDDLATAIAVDAATSVTYIAGSTNSPNLSTSAGSVQSANAGGSDGFVAKLNAAGSAFLYATYLGGNRNDVVFGLAVDPTGNAYVTGYTTSNTFPTNMPIQPSIQNNSTALFRTSNTGANWTPFDANLPDLADSVSPDPMNAGTLLASTNSGLYRTTNSGGTWTQQFFGGWRLARSPANPATIYARAYSAIYQSVDNGLTWGFRGALIGCCTTWSDIIADPINASTAYAFNRFDSGKPAVEKTVDGGATWVIATTGLPAGAFVRSMAAGSDGNLYVGLSPGGVYKSTNQGASWAAVNTGLPSNFSTPWQGLAVAPTNPSTLYVSDSFSLYKSSNGGATWTTVGPLPGSTSALAVSSANSATLHYGAYQSTAPLWVSTDSGGTWSPVTGLGVASVREIVVDSANAAGAYALASGFGTLLLVGGAHAAGQGVPFVAKIDSAGQNMLYSTYLGDNGRGFGVAVNGTGDAFVTGDTLSPAFPVTPSAFQGNRSTTLGGSLGWDAFVARISDATAPCTYSVAPLQALELWYLQLIPYAVTAPSGCSWTASSNQPWATIVSGAAGIGSGIVYVIVDNNPTPGTRSATLTIAAQSATLRQRPASCGYNSFSPGSSMVPNTGGPVQFKVIVGAGCDWTIANNDPTAITVVSRASGTGNGSVTLNVAPNPSPNSRTFYISSAQGGHGNHHSIRRRSVRVCIGSVRAGLQRAGWAGLLFRYYDCCLCLECGCQRQLDHHSSGHIGGYGPGELCGRRQFGWASKRDHLRRWAGLHRRSAGLYMCLLNRPGGGRISRYWRKLPGDRNRASRLSMDGAEQRRVDHRDLRCVRYRQRLGGSSGRAKRRRSPFRNCDNCRPDLLCNTGSGGMRRFRCDVEGTSVGEWFVVHLSVVLLLVANYHRGEHVWFGHKWAGLPSSPGPAHTSRVS